VIFFWCGWGGGERLFVFFCAVVRFLWKLLLCFFSISAEFPSHTFSSDIRFLFFCFLQHYLSLLHFPPELETIMEPADFFVRHIQRFVPTFYLRLMVRWYLKLFVGWQVRTVHMI
jgi:hypothetical protein